MHTQDGAQMLSQIPGIYILISYFNGTACFEEGRRGETAATPRRTANVSPQAIKAKLAN